MHDAVAGVAVRAPGVGPSSHARDPQDAVVNRFAAVLDLAAALDGATSRRLQRPR